MIMSLMLSSILYYSNPNTGQIGYVYGLTSTIGPLTIIPAETLQFLDGWNFGSNEGMVDQIGKPSMTLNSGRVFLA